MGSKLRLNPALHDAYLREIVEQGGAPSVQTLVMKAVSLGGHGYLEESTAKRVYNSFAALLNDKIGSESPH